MKLQATKLQATKLQTSQLHFAKPQVTSKRLQEVR